MRSIFQLSSAILAASSLALNGVHSIVRNSTAAPRNIQLLIFPFFYNSDSQSLVSSPQRFLNDREHSDDLLLVVLSSNEL